MRLSNNLMYKNSLASILDNQKEVNKAQQQVSTQKRVLTASDDPSAMARALLYGDKIQTNEQYAKNTSMLKGRLDTQETMLDNINDSLLKAQQLAIQAGNGALSQSDKAGLAEEVESIKSAVFGWMNAKSEDGRYIFSGYQDNTQTYAFDQTQNKYVYNGDQGQHKIKVAEGVEIRSSDNGFDVFEKVNKRLDIDRTSIAPATATVYVNEQGAFDNFHKTNYNADPTAPATANTITINVTSATTFDVVQGGSTIQSGTFSGNEINVAGMDMSFAGAAPTSFSFDLEKPTTKNILNTLDDLSAALKNPGLSAADYQQELADAVVGIANAKNTISQTQSSLGGRFNTVDRIASANSSLDINNKAAKAELVEIDMAEAISELTKHETALQASQATFGRLSNLSLLDYIR
ncbi:flagellar hook-associated protein FlgL [Pseudoalteromonas sp. A25]|uniref:flagellar hook-associated protein FlgL n=1 Tax=Pseudoalteromonas sp. A25 TaxID=116092 RepID=UPI0012609B60|nr:flagellar hook-associated protein FlgL [Pseudoalteromonas sp. A25]BBN81074.1 flagellar hook-associated protein FlgL [Pseudoalteromonas sp. A25]